MAPPPRPRQLDSPLLPKIFKYAGRVQVALYRRSGGRIGGKWRIGAGFRKPVPSDCNFIGCKTPIGLHAKRSRASSA